MLNCERTRAHVEMAVAGLRGGMPPKDEGEGDDEEALLNELDLLDAQRRDLYFGTMTCGVCRALWLIDRSTRCAGVACRYELHVPASC
jgi:hypothetical protein